MDDITLIALVVLAIAAAFVGGTMFGKNVVSEAEAIKEHFTSEVAALRAELAGVLGDAAKKVS